MPSTYSPKLKFELIAPGEQPGLWGDTTNKNVGDLIEQAIAGVTTLNLTSISGNYTLTSLDGTVDQARSAVISCQGTAAGAISVIIPTSTKLYVFRNACGQTITIKTAGQVGGVVLANGEANSVFCDGTNALAGLVTAGAGTIPVSGGGTGQTSFTSGFVVSPPPGGTTALTTVSKIGLTTDVVNTLPVTNGGTGRSSLTANNVLLGDGTNAVQQVAPGANGNVLTSNGTTWQSIAPTTGTVTAVFGRTGAVTAVSTDYSAYYYPLSGNPSGFITSSSLTGYANLTSANTMTGSGSITATGTSIGDQRLSVTYAGNSSGLSPSSLQLNAPGNGVLFTPSGAWDGSTALGLIMSGGAGNLQITTSDTLYTGANDCYKQGSTSAWIIVSDARIKKNVTPYTKGLTELNQINIKNFEFNGLANSIDGNKAVGVIADEIEQVLPDTIKVNNIKLKQDDTERTAVKHFDSTELVYLLVNAVKELSAEVATLKAKVGA